MLLAILEQLCPSAHPPTSKVGLRTSKSLACDPHWQSVSILRLPGKLGQQSSEDTKKTLPFVPSSVWRHHVTRKEGPVMKLPAGFLLLWQNIGDNPLPRRKNGSEPTFSEVSARGYLALLLLSRWHTEDETGKYAQNKADFTVAGKAGTGRGLGPPVNQLPPPMFHFLKVLQPSRSIQLGTRPLGHIQRENCNTWISTSCGVCCLVSGSCTQTLLKKKLLFLCLVMRGGVSLCWLVSS